MSHPKKVPPPGNLVSWSDYSGKGTALDKMFSENYFFFTVNGGIHKEQCFLQRKECFSSEWLLKWKEWGREGKREAKEMKRITFSSFLYRNTSTHESKWWHQCFFKGQIIYIFLFSLLIKWQKNVCCKPGHKQLKDCMWKKKLKPYGHATFKKHGIIFASVFILRKIQGVVKFTSPQGHYLMSLWS